MFRIFKKMYYKLLGKDYEIYSNELIKHLEYEHENLFEIYKDLLKAFKDKNYDKIPKILNKLAMKYQLHIQIEDKQLYTYLERLYNGYPELVNWIEKKQNEMNNITNALLNFYNRYKNPNYLKSHTNEGYLELEKIGGVLTKRVKMEQNKLYKLYVKKEELSIMEISNIVNS